MKKSINISVLLLLLSFSINLVGQDKIFKKNNEVILCKVIKVDANYIKYSQPKYQPNVTFNIAKSKVSKIVYANGKVLDFEKSNPDIIENDEEEPTPIDLSSNKKNALKVDILAPIFGNITIGYERSLAPQKSIEATLGIIGIGGKVNPLYLFFMIPNKNPHEWVNPAGFFIKLGYKLIRDPKRYSNRPHLLKGAYLRPDILFNYFNSDQKVYYSNPIPGQDIYSLTKIEHTLFGFFMNVGKQWTIQNTFLFDFHLGLGYCYGAGDQGGYFYSHTQGNQFFPMAITAGVKVGVLL